MIKYIDNIDSITEKDLDGFFVGWPNPPSIQKHFEILKNSTFKIIAIDTETNKVVGFINALSDNILYAYIPLLEVLPDYQKKGIGTHLLELMFDKTNHLYSLDLCCDKSIVPFYKKLGLIELSGMIKRN